MLNNQYKWFSLRGKSLEMAQALLSYHNTTGGKPDFRALNDHLGLFTEVVQVSIGQGGHTGIPAWPALFQEPQTGAFYLHCPVSCDDDKLHVTPTNGQEISDKNEIDLLNSRFIGTAPIYVYDPLRERPPTPNPNPYEP